MYTTAHTRGLDTLIIVKVSECRMDMNEYSDRVKLALSFIKSKVDRVPRVALVLGSGLGSLAQTVEEPLTIPYEEIPGWQSSTAPGHAGRLVCGTLSGLPVVVMQGRLHCYEGYLPWDTTLPVRVFALWGVKTLILTNASGGVNWNYSAGDVALITDHINMTGLNPLSGPNNDEWGPRFPDMSEAYSRRMNGIVREAAETLGISLRESVYLGLAGPSYETPAEIRMARAFGADLVGMSTVHEVIVANHMGVEVCGISCVSNQAAGMNGAKLSHQEVLESMSRSAQKISALIAKTLELMRTRETKIGL